MLEWLGRVYVPDSRDQGFPASSLLQQGPMLGDIKGYQYWWSSSWWGNQGRTPQCVAYAWMHWLEDGPITHYYKNRDFDPWYLNPRRSEKHQPLLNPVNIYNKAQRRDRWPGENYEGTSVRAGAKVLKDLGVIQEYRWANSVNEVIDIILKLGPVVVGTHWYGGMYYPSEDEAIIEPTGSTVGGHAYVLNGVNKKKGFFRIKNSWGRHWGRNGHAYISIEDFESLLNDYGEACFAVETTNEGLV